MDIILKIIKEINNPFIIAILAFLLSIIFIFKSYFIKKIDNIKLNRQVKKKKIISLLDHDVFPTMVRVRNEVGNMKFYTDQKFDRVKTRMCFDFTKHKVKQCAISMKTIVERKDIDYISRNALKNYILKMQNYMHEEYIKEIEREWASKGVVKEDREYVIRLFEKFRYDVVSSFEHRINSIFGNENYNTNFKLTLAIFEMWSMGIDLLPRDMSTTFEALNGKFKNLKY